jgi:hypothetical protein
MWDLNPRHRIDDDKRKCLASEVSQAFHARVCDAVVPLYRISAMVNLGCE